MSKSTEVRISEPIDGTRWVYCGEGEHAVTVRVTQTGCIIPSLQHYWPGDIPNLIAALEAANEIAYRPLAHSPYL
jgi:hypothetical protein